MTPTVYQTRPFLPTSHDALPSALRRITEHFCFALAMFGYGLESHQTSAISSLAGLRIETTIGTNFCVSGDQEQGLYSTESPDDC